MKKRCLLFSMFLLILVLIVLNLSGIYPKQVEVLPRDMEQQKNYNGGDVT